jgi:hypothetical protein
MNEAIRQYTYKRIVAPVKLKRRCIREQQCRHHDDHLRCLAEVSATRILLLDRIDGNASNARPRTEVFRSDVYRLCVRVGDSRECGSAAEKAAHTTTLLPRTWEQCSEVHIYGWVRQGRTAGFALHREDSYLTLVKSTET